MLHRVEVLCPLEAIGISMMDSEVSLGVMIWIVFY
jgi:hypothetical protein